MMIMMNKKYLKMQMNQQMKIKKNKKIINLKIKNKIKSKKVNNSNLRYSMILLKENLVMLMHKKVVYGNQQP